MIYLDCDDLICQEHIEALVSVIKGTRCLGMSRWGRFVNDPSEAQFPNRKMEKDLPGLHWLTESWMDSQPMMQSGMFLIPRGLVETHGGWDERLSLIDDFEFFARMIGRSDGVRFAPDARLYYRSGIIGSLSGRKSYEAVKSQILSLCLGVDHLIALEDTPRTRLASANMLQRFEYEHYPNYPELRAQARARIQDLGGADTAPVGPPNFHRLRRIVGWRVARRVQLALGR